MAHAPADDGWSGLRRDAHGRRVVRRWYPGDLKALGLAFATSIVLVVVVAALLEWAAGR